MTAYHFVSTWRLHAPIEGLGRDFHTERWPSWWKYVHRVDQLDPGDADGLGRRQHLVFTIRLPYQLGFDIQVRHLQPPTALEAVATGELDGVGCWTLAPVDGGTPVRYDSDLRDHQVVDEPGRRRCPGGPLSGTTPRSCARPLRVWSADSTRTSSC